MQTVLDARWLECPEPLEQTLTALPALGPEDSLLLLIHRLPYPLFDLLRDAGYDYQYQQEAEGSFQITIRRLPSQR
ncbi:DUF2249 domain-containing protein [Parachitinimonas caeni]|uniref:DUF2249 domain-containing protein n=1 Tax=Parachitinimonas caeni TaxID=3031301 RepID=A0ABT7E0B3_9NEIS|nr:DUF2249 domain-containing protein [Parachitinimonas caeni]MDK2125750.1 DUF2249 domain-containing protein [Parachitinimonas caeni]